MAEADALIKEWYGKQLVRRSTAFQTINYLELTINSNNGEVNATGVTPPLPRSAVSECSPCYRNAVP